MIREFKITVYLLVWKILFNLFSLFPQKEKTTFIASFPGNICAAIKALEQYSNNHKIVILKSNGCKANYENHPVLHFESFNIFHVLQSIYHMATSRYVIVDNYFGILAVTAFRPGTKCVQLWHAAGAIKHFGLNDLSVRDRSVRAIRRFKHAYDRFDHVVVGSEQMIDIFKENFDLPEGRFMRTGIPRTDFFFDDIRQREALKDLQKRIPAIKKRKVILYAPTYRDNELHTTKLNIELDKLYEHLKFNYVLLLRLHPAVNGTFENKYPGFIHNVSESFSIDSLLVGADIVITDYSSIPFEFSLLNKPMIFYAYDLDEYALSRGIWEDYEQRVPGPVVKTTEEIIRVIEESDFQLEKVQPFAEEWNEYSKGNSSTNLIQTVYEFGFLVK